MWGSRKRPRHDADVTTVAKKSKSTREAAKSQVHDQVDGQIMQNPMQGESACTDATGVGKVFESMNATELGVERNASVQKKWMPLRVPRKKHKKRSRQKNLKRDRRAPNEKPSYLTEETLRGGRL